MALEEGTTLGQYRIGKKLGSGGMGEVYRARDLRLNRDVAIKVLPERLRTDPERRLRLEREARMLAAVSASSIASIHGLEEDDGILYLVLELVPGEPLATILGRRRMAVDEALRICLGVAAGLEAAHAGGVIHRDLKPANVMVASAGVKLLDFGLARPAAPETGGVGSDAPTQEPELSGSGQIVGTLGYMAPEQLRGVEVDERADIWALGCLLYETLTGRRAFEGRTQSELAAAVLASTPDWRLLSPYPAQLQRLVRRCLCRDPDRRLHAAADARVEIQEVIDGLSDPDVHGESATTGTRRSLSRLAVGALVALLVALAGWSYWGWTTAGSDDGEPARLEIALPAELQLAYDAEVPSSIAISDVGGRIAFAAVRAGEERPRLFLRSLTDFEVRVVPATEGARAPFFSPDGAWVAFFADGLLKKVPVGGGAVTTLCAADPGLAGSWGEDGTIVFAPSFVSALWRVDSGGGEPAPLSRLDPGRLESGHHAPTLLPDGRHVLFSIWEGGHQRDARIAVQRIGEQSHRVLLEGGSHPRFVAPDILVYSRGETLMAVPFDPVDLEVRGTPRPVLEEVQPTPYLGSPLLALSADGTLVYVTRSLPEQAGQIGLLDRSGSWEALIEQPGPYSRPRASPDGRFVAFHSSGDESDVWTYEIRRGVTSRITEFPGLDGFPVWSHDSTRIAYASTRDGPMNLYVRLANGAGEARQLLPPGNLRWPTSWSSDGSRLLYSETTAGGGNDLWLVELGDEVRARPLLNGPAHESWGRFSPDGRWIVFERREDSARTEIFIVNVEDTTQLLQVSPDGGTRPLWAPDGRSVIYTAEEGLVSAAVSLDGTMSVESPTLLVSVAEAHTFNDLGPGGEGFLGLEASPYERLGVIKVVLHWGRELRARVDA